MRISRAIPTGLVAAVLAMAASPASAQQHDDRFWLGLTGYVPTITSVARSDLLTTSRPGTTVNFEQDLGLNDRKALPMFQGGMRLGDDWRLELEYFSLERSGERRIARDISWGDVTFAASAAMSSAFDSRVLRVSAGGSFLRTPGTELGAVLGLHATRFKVALSGQGSIGNVSAATRVEAQEALVPLPTIGLYGRHDFAPNWSVAGRIDLFALSFGDYDGALVNLMIAVNHRFNPRVTGTLGLRYVDYSLDLARTNWKGSIDYRFNGPYLGVQVGF